MATNLVRNVLVTVFTLAAFPVCAQQFSYPQLVGQWNNDTTLTNLDIKNDYSGFDSAKGEFNIGRDNQHGANIAVQWRDYTCSYRATLANQGQRMTWEFRSGDQGCRSLTFSKISGPASAPAPPVAPGTPPGGSALSRSGRRITHYVNAFGTDMGECGDYDPAGRPVAVVCDDALIPCGNPGGLCVHN